MRTFILACLVSLTASPTLAQSLFLAEGRKAVSAGTGWSVGPSSTGIESGVSVGLGRVDLGVALNRYTFTADEGWTSKWSEYAPFVRVFLVREQSGAPVGLSVGGQVFFDDYDGDDSGRYAQLSTTVYKSFELGRGFSLHPFAGFGFVAESYTFSGVTERAEYLTRDFGLHVVAEAGRSWAVQMTLLDQSFRRETYRSARIALIRTF